MCCLAQLKACFIRHPERHMFTWRYARHAFDVLNLIVEENVWLEYVKYSAFSNAT